MTPQSNDATQPERKHPRIDLKQPVSVQIPDWSALGAEVVNIGHGGMRLRIQQRMRRGDRMVFRAELPGTGTFAIEAEVRHVTRVDDEHYEVGLCWLEDDVRAVYLFETLVRDQLNRTPFAA